MVNLPSSLTAVVHMRFHFDEHKKRLVGEAEIQVLDELLGRAGDLEPELQEMLVKFADYVSMSSTKRG